MFVYLRCRASCGWFDKVVLIVCLSKVLLDFRFGFPCCCVCLFKQGFVVFVGRFSDIVVFVGFS